MIFPRRSSSTQTYTWLDNKHSSYRNIYTYLETTYYTQTLHAEKKMSATCLQLTEATLGFPNSYDDGKTEVTLWGPETINTMPGAAAWMSDDDAYRKILLCVTESGMHWSAGPYLDAVLNIINEMEEWEEHGTEYEKWSQQDANMDDLHEPSYFLEWNQCEGAATWVGGGELHKNRAKVPQFTPEMLIQRDTLNWFYNFEWNTCSRFTIARYVQNSIVPDQTELLELVAVGDNHGVAKCRFGSVYVPKSALTYLRYNGGCEIGTIFDGEMTFTPDKKFLWRLNHNGITFTYQENKDDY